jgi:hypothetical protein
MTNKKERFTPGPWAFKNDAVVRASSFDDLIIAETYGEDWEHNARLIAAAPEMLEAIGAIVDAINRGTPGCRTSLTAIHDMLLPVYKKALGE